MAKIVSKKLWFDQPDMTDVKFFNIYYVQAPTPVTYDTQKVVITAVPTQTAYEVDIPLMVPIGEGTYNLVYTGDFKFEKTQLLDAAQYSFPRVETLMIESTYGAKEDICPQGRK